MGSASGFRREAYFRDFSALTSSEETFFDAEDIEESVTAPVVGEAVYFSRGPMVEGNLTLSSGDTTYTLGVHYLEAVSPDGRGGFENLAIPAGTSLAAEYFVDASGTAPAGGSSPGAGYADVSVRSDDPPLVEGAVWIRHDLAELRAFMLGRIHRSVFERIRIPFTSWGQTNLLFGDEEMDVPFGFDDSQDHGETTGADKTHRHVQSQGSSDLTWTKLY